MNPLMRSTLYHTKLKGKDFLQWIDFDIIQDKKEFIFNGHEGPLRSSSTILTLATFSIDILLLHICLPSFVKIREQLRKFCLSQTGHCSQKFRTLFHVIVCKHQSSLCEDGKQSVH